MKNIILSIFLMVLAITAFTGCKDELTSPDATFSIQKDTIIDGKKVRVDVNVISLGEQVYFVSNNSSMFNSVWPGDSVYTSSKPNTTIYHDYDTQKQLVNLIINKKDTLMKMNTAQYKGIAVPFGSKELPYKYASKGELTATWVATNANASDAATAIMQKKITVK